jgi:asparagine synthase (glutamine-hydrolysing)
MSWSLRHRGPDGEGQFVWGEIGLGHRRLSIIDLRGGAQPISNEDDSLQIVFNGEIYNYVELGEELRKAGHIFRTQSDTEVILHAFEEWGYECVSRFNGIFSFAIWDSEGKQLFLARDHLGVKPLYYTVLGKRFLFASEIKALLQDPDCPREVDLQAMSQLFTLRYVPSPGTLFRGIHKLRPGHRMVVTKEGIDVQRYWKWTPHVRKDLHEASLIESYRELLEDSVRLQMRSDVPVGLFLSSGIDSGVLLALMNQHSSGPVHTFTIGFEDGEHSNETSGARTIASRFGADHNEFIVTAKDYLDYYGRYMWDLEEPVGNESAAAFHFVSWIASKKVKVVLTGQGADEPWAGYHRYLGAKLSQVYSRLPRMVTEGLIRTLVNTTSKNERIRRGVESLSEKDILSRLIKIYSFYSADMKEKLFQPWVLEHISADGAEARRAIEPLQRDVCSVDALTQMMYIDTRANLPDDLLMVGDKTSMANSLEARVPFLDYRIVEFAESLPGELKLHGVTGKYLHKKAVEKWLPKAMVYQTKKGFANPVNKWLQTRMSEYVRDCLLSETSGVRNYFSKSYIQQLIVDHEKGLQNYQRHVYLLMSFEMWHRRFIASRSDSLGDSVVPQINQSAINELEIRT